MYYHYFIIYKLFSKCDHKKYSFILILFTVFLYVIIYILFLKFIFFYNYNSSIMLYKVAKFNIFFIIGNNILIYKYIN